MTNEKTYFTVNEALEDILDILEKGYDGYLGDLHNEVFNTKYYITGIYEAKQALTQYGVFEAIEEIQEYEKFHFGEVFTEMGDPEKVANMLYYLKGYEAAEKIQECNDLWDENWNNEVDEETRLSLIETIRALLGLTIEPYEIVELYALTDGNETFLNISQNEKEIDEQLEKFDGTLMEQYENIHKKIQGYGILNKKSGFLLDDSEDFYDTLDEAESDLNGFTEQYVQDLLD